MQQRIEKLDQYTIDRIAAGEVVERPRSVVKELLENAIDAGADVISIELIDGGLSRIRVSDNGSGIEKDEIPMAFLRHATSKIHAGDDLMFIRSLGFRGEALASIAAVSHTTMITKTKDSLFGHRYKISAGKEEAFSEIGAPDGTSIIVEDLFFNTPARKKFLKSARTEAGYVADMTQCLALSHPDIAFRLLIDKKERLHTLGSNSSKNVIYELFGRETRSALLDVSYEDDYVKIEGFLGKSILSRANRAFETFFVNGRYIKDDALSKALELGYEGFMMQHRFPFAVLYFTFHNASVDVNVHPTKMEVRFEQKELLLDILSTVVKNRLSQREDIEPVVLNEPEENVFALEEQIPIVSTGIEPFEKKRLDTIKESLREAIKTDTVYDIEYKEEQIKRANARAKEYEQSSFLSKEAQKNIRIIGQLFGTYWLFEYMDSLYVLDQHAAHEKILYEKTMAKLSENTFVSQQISPPQVITLSASERERLDLLMPYLLDFGYLVEEFGGNDVCIKAVPADFYTIDKRDLFLSLLADDLTKKASSELIKERIASMSCKAAVKGNHMMREAEAKALLKELMDLENPYHCPHGRPTIISFSHYELDKKFKRIL